MLYRCHNCDKGTTAGKVVELLDSDTYKEYVKERFVGNIEKIEYDFKPPKFKKRDPKLKDLVPINKLNGDHPALEVLKKRQIPEEHYDKFFLCHKFYVWASVST